MSTTGITLDEAGRDGPGNIEDMNVEDLEDLDELEDLDDGDDAIGDPLDEDGLDDDGLSDDDDTLVDALDTDGAGALDVVTVATDGVTPKAGKAARATVAADPATETETADDDELLSDEVEASLDVILAERLRGEDTEVDEEQEDEDDDAPNQLATVIPVRRPDEFLCQSCFLLKPPAQLADRDHQLCRDCA